MSKKKAIIIGATGAAGQNIVEFTARAPMVRDSVPIGIREKP